MFSNNSGSTSAVWLAMLACTATAALAAKLHLNSEEARGSERYTVQAAAVETQPIDAAVATAGMARTRLSLGATPAPATPTVEAPRLEGADLEEPRRFSVELRRPSMKLPPIARGDYTNTLVDRLIAAERLRAAPAHVAVEAPNIQEPRFEDAALRGTELPRPDRPKLPAVRP